jgi:hypothetical protein
MTDFGAANYTVKGGSSKSGLSATELSKAARKVVCWRVADLSTVKPCMKHGRHAKKKINAFDAQNGLNYHSFPYLFLM